MADPLLGPRCTRRKQANPRRKNVELEDMPEEVDLDHLGPNDAVAAAASMKETPPTVVTEAATTSTHHRTPVDHRPKTHVSPTTRRPDDSENFGDVEDDCRAGDDDDDDDNSSHCASKDACSVNSVTSERRRTMMVVPSSPPNSPSGAHPVPKLHAALVAPGDGSGGAGGQPPTQPTLLTPSAAESHEDEDDKSEEEKIQEYLRRSDTAVIYPEPVDGDPSSNAHTSSPAPAVAGNNNNNTDHKGSLEISRTPTIKDEFYLKCPHCDQVYPNVDSLRVHLVTQHGATESAAIASVAAGGTGGYSCDKCSATFAQKGQLEKHEDLHSPTAQVVACKVCNKTFANVYRLQRHMISHDESAVLRKFKCPECEKAFKFKHHLKEHIRIHSGEKPFACPNCGKRFSHSGSYSSHMTSKKCLVMNLKVRRTIDKPNMRGNGVASAGVMACHGGVGGGGGGGGRRGSSQGAFTPILPKYGENGLELSPSFSTPSGLSMSDHYAAALDFVPSSMQAFLPPPYGLHPLLTGNHHHHPHFTNSGLSAFAGLAGPPPPLASLSHMIRPSAIAVKTMLDDVQDTCFVQQRDSAVAPSLSSPHSEAEEAVRTFGPLSPGVPNPCGDLKAVKKILATVNATVSKQQEMGKLRNGLSVPNHQDGTRVTSTPSPTTSRTESPLTTTTAVSSPRSPTLSASVDNAMKRNGLRGDDSHCRHCGDFFESKIDLHQHERYICKMNRENFPVSKEDTASLVNDFTPSIGDKGSHTSMNGFSDMDDDPLMSDADDCNRDIGDDSMMMLAGDGRKVRMRSLFSEEHQAVLRSYYETNARPAKEDLQRIAAEIKFPPRVVQVWFQNMRARDKKRGRTRDGNQLSRSFCSDDVSLPPLQQQQPIQHASTPFSAISPPSTYGGSAFNGGVMTSRLPHMPIFYPTPSPSPFSLPTAPLRLNGHCLSSSSSSPPAPPSFVAPQFPLDHEQPLDLSVKGGQKTGHQRCQNSCHSPAASDHSGASDGEALNLSQKSSRTSTPSKESNNHNNNSYAMVTTSVAHNGVQLNDTAALMKSAESNNIFKYMMTTPKMEMEELSAGEDTPDLVVVRRGFSGSPTTCDTPRLHRILASSPHLDISSLNGMVDSSGRVYSTDGSHSPCPSDHDDQLEIDEGSNHHRRCWKQMGHGDDCHLDMDDSSLGEDDRPLKRRKSWKQHKLDAEEGMYACDQCDKVFSKQSSLARHKYEHSGQRPHKCDVCAKAFKHKHHLTEHKRLHSGEKPFQCKKCLKRFSHSGSYSQHMNHRYSYCKPYRE